MHLFWLASVLYSVHTVPVAFLYASYLHQLSWGSSKCGILWLYGVLYSIDRWLVHCWLWSVCIIFFENCIWTFADAKGEDVTPFVDITNTHANRLVAVRYLKFYEIQSITNIVPTHHVWNTVPSKLWESGNPGTWHPFLKPKITVIKHIHWHWF